MSTRVVGAESSLVRSKDDLVGWIAAGEKPKSAWRIGTEHEKFVFYTEAWSRYLMGAIAASAP